MLWHTVPEQTALADGAPTVPVRLVPHTIHPQQAVGVRFRVARHVRTVPPLQAHPGQRVKARIHVRAGLIQHRRALVVMPLLGLLPCGGHKPLAERVRQRRVGKESSDHLAVEPDLDVAEDGCVALSTAVFEVAVGRPVVVGPALVPG
jgi:hypothetical protein